MRSIVSNNVNINTDLEVFTQPIINWLMLKKGKGEYALFDLKAEPFELATIYNQEMPIVKNFSHL